MYRMQQRVLALKIETTPGTEVAATLASDAIKAEGIRITPNFPPVETNEHQDGLDLSDPQFGAGWYDLAFGVNFRGSSNPGTTPPVHDAVLRMCGFARSDVAAAVTGTAQAGGANSITLASGESSTANIYKGMPIEITGGTGAGQWNVITAYNGTTKAATVQKTWGTNPDNTSEYSIPALSRYALASQGLEAASGRVWDKEQSASVNSRLQRAAGLMGNLRGSLDPHGLFKGDVSAKGLVHAAPANVADPGAATYAVLNPPIYNAAETIIGATAGIVGTFGFDLGNQVELPDHADATFGYQAAQIVNRRVTGGLTPRLELLSARNWFSDWISSPTPRAFSARFGAAAGSRILVFVPALQPVSLGDADVRGFTHHDVQFKAQGVDSAIYLTFF